MKICPIFRFGNFKQLLYLEDWEDFFFIIQILTSIRIWIMKKWYMENKMYVLLFVFCLLISLKLFRDSFINLSNDSSKFLR